MTDRFLFPSLPDKIPKDAITAFCHLERIDEMYFRLCANRCLPHTRLPILRKRGKRIHEADVMKALLMARIFLARKTTGILRHHH